MSMLTRGSPSGRGRCLRVSRVVVVTPGSVQIRRGRTGSRTDHVPPAARDSCHADFSGEIIRRVDQGLYSHSYGPLGARDVRQDATLTVAFGPVAVETMQQGLRKIDLGGLLIQTNLMKIASQFILLLRVQKYELRSRRFPL
jgi:hypothetical protein